MLKLRANLQLVYQRTFQCLPPLIQAQLTHPPLTLVWPTCPPLMVAQPTFPPLTAAQPTCPPLMVAQPACPLLIVAQLTCPPLTVVMLLMSRLQLRSVASHWRLIVKRFACQLNSEMIYSHRRDSIYIVRKLL